MKAIQDYYDAINVPPVFTADVEGLLSLAVLAEDTAVETLRSITSRETALADESYTLDVYYADELMTVASLRLQVCLCISEQECDATCVKCTQAFKDMLRSEDELEILNK